MVIKALFVAFIWILFWTCAIAALVASTVLLSVILIVVAVLTLFAAVMTTRNLNKGAK